MKRYILHAFLFIFFASCSETIEYDDCLQNLEIVKTYTDTEGNKIFEVIGNILSVGPDVRDLKEAILEALKLDSSINMGTLMFEENHPNYIGYFLFYNDKDKSSLNLSKIKQGKKYKVVLRRVKLKKIIPLTKRKQKNVEYLYIVENVESI